MTKMATMPIYGKNPSKIMSLKNIGPQGLFCPHRGAKYMYITISVKRLLFWNRFANQYKAKFYMKHL